jgi:hypothetical protein
VGEEETYVGAVMKEFGGVFPFYREDKTGAKFAVLWGVTLLLFAAFGCLLANAAPKHTRKQMQPDRERVMQIQDALVRVGKLPAVTGNWDKPTWDALRAVATEHGWSTCHVPDARVLNVLGLGAATAGIAAPPPSPDDDRLAIEIAKYEKDHPEACHE